jgi:hypothetical protein
VLPTWEISKLVNMISIPKRLKNQNIHIIAIAIGFAIQLVPSELLSDHAPYYITAKSPIEFLKD